MRYLTELFATVAERVKSPVCIALGAPRPISHLVAALPGMDITCFQMDHFPAERLKEELIEREVVAEVVLAPDLWDLPQKFQTVILPAGAYADRELKLDMLEQGYHILQPGGLFLTLSEYEKDTQFAKLHKKMFGKCGQTPSTEHGIAFFSTKVADDRPRRRHEVNFHAKHGDGGPSMNFLTRPGIFSYGRMDSGSRALLEVADIRAGDHILDLGSGAGAVGCLAASKAGPKGKVTFIDSNLRATQLSDINAKANGLTDYTIVESAKLEGLGMSTFDVVLANPPYYGDSMVARLFVQGSRDLLKTGGRFYIVTKMPTAVVPLIFESFGECDVIENRGYSVVCAVA